MKRWILIAFAVGRDLKIGIVEAVVDFAKTTVERLQSGVDAVLEWHRRRMVTDPRYPAALLTIGKAIVGLVVPRATVAAALIALLAEILSGPHWYSGGSDQWGDDY